MQSFADFKTQTKLFLLLVPTFLVITVMFVLMILSQRETMLEDRISTIKNEVDTVHSLIEHFYNAARAGTFPEDAAKSTATDILKDLRYGNNEYFFVFDQNNLELIQNPYSQDLIGKNLNQIKDKNGQSIYVEMQRIVRNSQSNTGTFQYAWSRSGGNDVSNKLSYVKLFQPWNWTIGTGLYLDDVEEDFQALLTRNVIIFIIIYAIVGFLVWFIAKQISAPLEAVSKLMHKVGSDKDLTQRSDVNNTSESGIIAHSLNVLLEQFQDSIQTVVESSNLLTDKSTGLATSAEETHLAISDQTSQIEQIATAINEMSATVEEVAGNTEKANAQTHVVDDHAHQGVSIITTTMEQISRLADEVENVATVINELQQEAQGIGDIVSVITSIADQTNLLALNAAIEAARAGEQGRGFAVVADEVRSLASKTQESTEEIRSKIESLQSGTERAFTRMNTGQEQARASESKMQEASQAFDGIASAVAELASMIAQIATASTEQASVAEEINRNITEVNGAAITTNEQANQIKEISEAVSDQARTMNSIAQSFTV